ncbi:MAG: aminotransferase class I and II [Gemmatimonadota bacterium]
MQTPVLRRDAALYLTPLREGGSLPGVVETVDGTTWVVKFRGAGQGPKALVAELLVADLAETLGLPVPDRSLVMLDEAFGQGERDPEIQDVLAASRGVNVGLRYMDGAFNLDPVAVPESVDEAFATALVWLDALVTNPDRSARNPNLMFWNDRSWLIDHGAALYFHHDWSRVTRERLRAPFPGIRDHVLLTRAGNLSDADPALADRLTPQVLEEAVGRLPEDLLADPLMREAEGVDPPETRRRYLEALTARLEAPRAFATAAESLRTEARATRPTRLESRR